MAIFVLVAVAGISRCGLQVAIPYPALVYVRAHHQGRRTMGTACAADVRCLSRSVSHIGLGQLESGIGTCVWLCHARSATSWVRGADGRPGTAPGTNLVVGRQLRQPVP